MAFLWTSSELSDLGLPWPEFSKLHPGRTRKAWRCRREARRDGPARTRVSDEDAEKAKKLWALMAEMQELVTPDVPTEISVSVPDSCIALAFLADLHIGGLGVDYETLLHDVDLIAKTDGVFTYLGGDGIDNFILPKLINASREQLISSMPQWLLFEDVIRRLQNKVLAIGDGNHTAWTQMLSGIDKVGEICAKWGKVYTGEGGLVNLTVGTQLYRIFRHHRFRFSSYLHKAHPVIRMWETGPTDFDLGIIEHRHEPHIEAFWRHGEYKIAIRTGSMKVNDAYACSHGFYGASSLVPTVVLDGRTKKMTPFLDLHDAITYLRAIRQGT